MYRNGRQNAFIAHPKAASMAVARILRQNDWRKTSNHHEMDFPMPKNVISVIREPEDWFVSWYFYRRSDLSFEEWLVSPHDDFITNGFFGLPHTTHLVFFDRLQVGFNAVFEDIGLPRLHFPLHNVTFGRNGANLFTDSTRNLLDKDLVECYASLRQRLGEAPFLRMKQ